MALLCVLSDGALAQRAQRAQAEAGAGVCQRCHEAGLPLPASHEKVKGAALSECTSCHASQIGQAKPYAFAAKLHRAHIAQIDCTSCHAFTPGKRFAAATGRGNLGAIEVEDYERMRKAVATLADSKTLAAKHADKQNLSCGACHRTQWIPDDNETVLNRQCASCHGGYDKMAAVSKAKIANADINPHGSHLGPQIACTVCHQGHVESKPYCLNCHTNFTMPIP